MSEYSDLGNRLKSIRTSRGLSLTEAATMTGVSKTMLSQIERAESIPTIATISKIANGLKIKYDSLLEDNSISYDIKSIRNIPPFVDNHGKILLYPIFPFSPSNGFEFFYCVLKPGCNHNSLMHKNGHTEYAMVF